MPRAAKVTMVVERPDAPVAALASHTYRFSMDRLLLIGATTAFWAVIVTAIRLLAF